MRNKQTNNVRLKQTTLEGLKDLSFKEEVLDKEFVNGSEFFLTKDLVAETVAGLTFPPNFQTP